MSDFIDTLILLALPAAGKSEVRRYLAHLDDETRRKDLLIGRTAQLDDYPYVHLMRRASQVLRELGCGKMFFPALDRPWIDERDWGALIELINEDYADLLAHRAAKTNHAGEWILDRIEAAGRKIGIPPRLSALDRSVWKKLADALKPEAEKFFMELNEVIMVPEENRTIVIELARGGSVGSAMPLPAPFGYQYSLALLRPEILSQSAILYVWVTPEESRRKNRERADPNDPGSILHHGVPEAVLLQEYGCDDIDWLEAGHPGIARIEAHGRVWNIPIARFDNREDKTSFLRGDPAAWPKDKTAALHSMFKAAMQSMPGLKAK